ncbi:hypothetical protein GCM10009544_55540 [Streptomyces stramineus]|uniref:SpdD protein n=1 Tax=Streptomyces stramineus TaxID=173861 RepID=A0ABP3KX82_9ACTN
MGYDDQADTGPPAAASTRERKKDIGAMAGAGATGIACGVSVVSSLGLASGGFTIAIGLALSAAATAVAKWRNQNR